MNNYFSKKTKKINSNILLEGSNLQIKIWKELIKIPYGKTKSYGEIAKVVKTSPRYVGKVKHMEFESLKNVIDNKNEKHLKKIIKNMYVKKEAYILRNSAKKQLKNTILDLVNHYKKTIIFFCFN